MNLPRSLIPIWNVYCALNRQTELERLVRWATERKLPGPRRLYEARLADERRRLLRYRLNAPRAFRWARWLAWLSHPLRVAPRYPAKGSAAAYRTQLARRG